MSRRRALTPQLRRQLWAFAHEFDIKIRITSRYDFSECTQDTKITIGTKGWNNPKWHMYTTEEIAWSEVIHEVIHALCYRTGKWPAFHKGIDGKRSGEAFRRTAVKAELWVEDMAEKGLKAMYPSYRFYRSYTRSGASIEWLRTHYHTIKKNH